MDVCSTNRIASSNHIMYVRTCKKNIRSLNFLQKKMTGELSPEEEQELVKLKKESGSAIVDEQILNPANKREQDELISQFDTNSSLQKVVKRIHPKKQPPKSCMVGSAAAAVVLSCSLPLFCRSRSLSWTRVYPWQRFKPVVPRQY